MLDRKKKVIWYSAADWSCKINQLHLCRDVKPLPNVCPDYDVNQSEDEVPVMLKRSVMLSTPSMPLLPGTLCSGVVAPNRVLSYLPNPSARAGYDTRSIFKRSLTGLNSEFSFAETSCLIKAEKPSLPYYLPIAGGRINDSYLSQGN